MTAVDEAIAGRRAGLRLLIAHLSDLHLRAPGRSYESYWSEDCGEEHNAKTVQALEELQGLRRRPDLIAVTGDLADGSAPEEYALFAEIFAGSETPVVVVPGNHDRIRSKDRPEGCFRENCAALLGGGGPVHPDSDDFHFKLRIKDWDVVGIDTSRIHVMSEAHREAVEDALSADPDVPALVLSHSPLLPVGNWVDRMAFHDRAFIDMLLRHPRVKAVLSGHVHLDRAWLYGGVQHLIAPSLSYGIGAGVGYRLVGLGTDGVLFSLRRELPGARRNMYEPAGRRQEGAVDEERPEEFATHPLRNPSIWPDGAVARMEAAP